MKSRRFVDILAGSLAGIGTALVLYNVTRFTGLAPQIFGGFEAASTSRPFLLSVVGLLLLASGLTAAFTQPAESSTNFLQKPRQTKPVIDRELERSAKILSRLEELRRRESLSEKVLSKLEGEYVERLKRSLEA